MPRRPAGMCVIPTKSPSGRISMADVPASKFLASRVNFLSNSLYDQSCFPRMVKHGGTRIGPSQTGKRQRRLLADEGLAADIIEAHQIGTLRSLRPAPSLASVHRNAKVHIRFKPVRLSCWDLDSRSSVDAVKPPWMVLATSILHGVKDSRIRIDNQSTDHFVHHVTEQTALFTSKIQAKNLITLFG